MLRERCTECEKLDYEDCGSPECYHGWRDVPEEQIVYVNAYTVTRHYGGPEEGGWWYNWLDCIETYPTRNKNAELVATELEEQYKSLEHGDIYSVLGGKEVTVRIESKPAENQTRERPYYE